MNYDIKLEIVSFIHKHTKHLKLEWQHIHISNQKNEMFSDCRLKKRVL